MSLLAEHMQDRGSTDPIFALGEMATKRAKELGGDKVVNATIGSLLNGDGTVATLKSVENAIREIPFNRMAAYAPIMGLPSFLRAMEISVFQDYRPEAYIGTVATPGGTGALYDVCFNYLGMGEKAITTSYCWGNYGALLRKMGRDLDTFTMFNADGETFNIEACKAACEAVLAEQDTLLLILNTPAHNPTGYTIADTEWDQLLDYLKDVAEKYQDKQVVLVLDVAYIDFSEPSERRMFKRFENLPDHMLTVVCASASKGYTMYGFRLGTATCIAPTEKAYDDFMRAQEATARATWSNSSRPAMEIIAHIYEKADRLAVYRKEITETRHILQYRADIFVEEAKKVGLKTCPYRAGFFIYLPTKDHEEAEKVAEKLREDNIFVVPLGDGVRIAICAIDESKISGMATKCKVALDH